MYLHSKYKELIRLSQKYLSGKATAEEKSFLERYYQYFQKDPKPSDHLSEEEKSLLKKSLLAKIKSNIHFNENSNTNDAVIRHLRWYWYSRAAVAAILILCIGAAIYYLYKNNSTYIKTSSTYAAANQTKNDIKPGGNKAVLILANGTVIDLSNSNNGILASQGNTQIIKLKDGCLSYNVSQSSNQILYNTVSIPNGGQYQVILPDGTKVWLNSASSLQFPTAFTGNTRNVELKGEGYFEVTHNAKHPFIVTAGKERLKVLGTKFNVMAYSDEKEINTTLIEGSVEISAMGKSKLMKPGDQARVGNKSNTFYIIKPDIKEALSWKNGEFWFDEQNIVFIMRQIARWYNVSVEYKGDVSNIVLSGVIPRKENVSQLLDVLSMAGKVHFIIHDKKITVIPN